MNAGEKTLEWLRTEQLCIDDEWAVEFPGGYSWWSGKNKQTIPIAGSRVGPEGEAGEIIRVETEVFEDMDLSDAVLPELNELMELSSMAGLVFRSDERRINLCSSVLVHEGIREWMGPMISMAAMIQLRDAKEFGKIFATHGWKPAHSGHPVSGLRETECELIEGVSEILMEHGKQPSRW